MNYTLPVMRVRDYGDDLLSGAGKKYLNLREQTTPAGRAVYVAKYSKKAFYDQAWLQYPMLNQARGHIFDAVTEEIITRPFDKVSNYLEHGTGSHVVDDDRVIMTPKINGFLCAFTRTGVRNEMIIQSSGSVLDENDFVRMARESLLADKNVLSYMNESMTGYTVMFECVHPDDPHIIKEKPGLYLIDIRDVRTGVSTTEQDLDRISLTYDIFRGLSEVVLMQEVRSRVRFCKHEGYMVSSLEGVSLFKIKSPHYLANKLIARAGQNRLQDVMTRTENYDEEVGVIVSRLRDENVTVDDLLTMTDQQRLDVISRCTDGAS